MAIKKRESGIELLRIILMIQIVFLHISEYGGYTEMAMGLGGRTEHIYVTLWTLCRCPVPLLIILTGYFMANREVTLRKMCSRWCSTHHIMLFYSVGIVLLFTWVNLRSFEIVGLPKVEFLHRIRMFFPFLNRTWFFMTNYLLIIFFSPFINKTLSHLSKTEYCILVVGLFFLLTVWTTLARIDETKDVVKLSKIIDNEQGKSLYMFLFCYILGGFIQKCIPERRWESIAAIVIFIALWIMGLYGYENWAWYLKVYRSSDSPFVIIQCVCLLLIFRSLHFHSGVINWIAKNNIGVYLIHEHPLVRQFIWAQFPMLFTQEFYSGRWKYVVIICSICVLVYVVCNLLEFFRSLLFECGSGLVSMIFPRNSRKV